MTELLGQPMTDLLLSTSHVDDPAWVQIAIQAVATLFVSCTIDSWHPHLGPDHNRMLTAIHEKIFIGGERPDNSHSRDLLTY